MDPPFGSGSGKIARDLRRGSSNYSFIDGRLIMLDGLDDIPWGELEHAYGVASDVPELIRSLTDPDPKVRSKTMWTLYGNVFHQGTRFPATPYVVPFLIELCGRPEISNRLELLSFWGSLITGYFSVRERPTWSDGEVVYGFGEPQKLDRTDPYSVALFDIYKNSLEGKELLYSLINEEELAVRAGAAWVLACLPTIADRSKDVLRTRLGLEKSGSVRAAITFAIGELGDVQTLEDLLIHDDFDTVQCMAACELARIAPDPSLVGPLLRFIENRIEGYENVPGAGGDSAGDAAFAITYLPKETRIKAVPEICARLETARSFAVMPFADALLSAAFEPTNSQIEKLTELQRQVLISMIECQELWTVGNLHFEFKTYGIPFDRKQCADLVGVKVVNDEALSKLSNGITFAGMGFLEKAREGIEKALAIDPAVFARMPEPAECWLFCAKAFAETDSDRAIKAFLNAQAIDPNISHRVEVTWQLADLLRDRGLGLD